MNYLVSASTDIGLTKDTNQDSFVAKTFHTPQGKAAFAVLCDGMGGLEKGEVASASLVNAFSKWADHRLPILCRAPICDSDIREDWGNIIDEYNEKIKFYGNKYAIHLGTTVTVILLIAERYYIANVGDTRAYEISDRANVLTRDQTVVAREVEFGQMTEEEAKTDLRRSVLLQCVGASDKVYPDFFFGAAKINAVYMLCSDGFRHEITDNEIYQYLNPNAITERNEMKKKVDTLIDLNKQRQERDNITAVCIKTL